MQCSVSFGLVFKIMVVCCGIYFNFLDFFCVQDMTLQQKTPIRVLHRRSLAVREKIVHSCSAKIIDDHHFDFHLKTQAGTYPCQISILSIIDNLCPFSTLKS